MAINNTGNARPAQAVNSAGQAVNSQGLTASQMGALGASGGSSVGSGSFSSYNPSTGITTYSSQPTAANPQGLSPAQIAANASGVATQAQVNASNYAIMANAGANASQIFSTLGGYGNQTQVPGLSAIQQANIQTPAQANAELMKPTTYTPDVSAASLTKTDKEDPAKMIREDAVKRANLATEVLNADKNAISNADFINKAALAALGRPATAGELTQAGSVIKDAKGNVTGYGLLGRSNAEVLRAFNLAANPKTGANGLPADSKITDKDGSIIDTDGDGIPDVEQSVTWKTQLNDLLESIKARGEEIVKLTKQSAEETALNDQYAQAKGSAQLGSLNLGQQLGEAMPLIQGEQAYLTNQANIQLQTLADRIGVLSDARKTNLEAAKAGLSADQANANMILTIQSKIDDEKQTIYNQMKDKSANAQKNLAMLLDNYQKAGGMDTKKMTADQKLQLQKLSNEAGLDSGIVLSSIDALWAESQLKKTSGGGSGGSTKKTPTVFKQIETNLLEQVGGDGFLNPADYEVAKNDWIQAGGAPMDFDKKFAGRRNPANPYYPVTSSGSTKNTKDESTDETVIKGFKDEGYTSKDLIEAGYNTDSVNKVFGSTAQTAEKKEPWWSFIAWPKG